MSALISLLATLNSLTPLAVIALLALVLFLQAKNHRSASDHANAIADMRDNDLHELPTILETLRRIETSQATGFATVIAKLSGR